MSKSVLHIKSYSNFWDIYSHSENYNSREFIVAIEKGSMRFEILVVKSKLKTYKLKE